MDSAPKVPLAGIWIQLLIMIIYVMTQYRLIKLSPLPKDT